MAEVEEIEQVATETENNVDKKFSPKHKSSRGVPEDMITTWVPFDQEKDLHETIAKAAKTRGISAVVMLAGILTHAIKANNKNLADDAAKYVAPSTGTSTAAKKLAEMTEEELHSYQQKQQKLADSALSRATRAGEAAREMLAKAREKKSQGHVS